MFTSKNDSIFSTLDYDDWTRFVLSHPNGNAFHTPELFSMFDRVKDHRPQIFCIKQGEDIVLLFLPVVVTLKHGFMRRLSSRSVLYGSVLYDESKLTSKLFSEFMKYYHQQVKKHSVFTELRNLSDISHLDNMLKENGFKFEEHINYILNIDRPVLEILQAISGNARGAIKRSQKKNLSFETVSERSRVDDFYQLLTRTFNRARAPLPDISYFESVFDVLVPKDMAKFFMAKAGDHYVACFLVLCYKDTVYWWYSAFDRQFHDFYPSDGMIWHVIEWAANSGYKKFDFGWAGRIDEPYGVRNFKAKYGGEMVTYGRHVFVHDPVRLAISKIGYHLYRRLMRLNKKMRL